MDVKLKLQALQEKFDALQTRERVLIVLATMFLLVASWDQLLIQPQRIENKAAVKNIAAVDSKVTMNRILKEKFEGQVKLDPTAREKMRLDRLKQETQKLDEKLAEHSLALISPQEMVAVLRDIVNNDQRLELLSMRSLAGVPVLTAGKTGNETLDSADDKDDMPNIYRHGLEIKFNGEYFAVIAYLKRLESLNWRFYWDSVRIQMDKYPVATVTVRLDTLSFVDAWIGM